MKTNSIFFLLLAGCTTQLSASAIYELRRQANLERIAARKEQDKLDMRYQDQQKAAEQQIIGEQKLKLELDISLDSEEYRNFTVPKFSPTEPKFRRKNKIKYRYEEYDNNEHSYENN